MNPTGTEARVCADIAARQAKGTAKYGTTVQDNPLGLIQWLQHAYEECLDQAVYLKRAIEQLTGVDEGIRIKAAIRTLEESGHSWTGGVLWRPPIGPRPAWLDEQKDSIPSNSAELEDPHAELRATWREGQRWQGIPTEWLQSGTWTDFDEQPGWLWTWTYRRHPEDKNPETSPDANKDELVGSIVRFIQDIESAYTRDEAKTNLAKQVPPVQESLSADPHAALKAIYRPGMRYRWRHTDPNKLSPTGWSYWVDTLPPRWASDREFEIHPDDLPKSPDTDGWITVPDDLMEMPEGLGNMDRVEVRFRSGATYSGLPAGAFAWKAMPVEDPARVVAYRLIKPAE